MTVSVIIPTIGRDTLAVAEASAAGADEVIVVRNQDGDYGYSARMRGMAQATSTHLAFLDDDDVYTPGAVETMRAHANDVPVIFRMDDPLHGILWRDPVLRHANVGTPMFLVPNVPDKLGVWAPFLHGHDGDFPFISGCVEKMGAPVWREEVVAVVRPHERGPSLTIVTPWLNHPELTPDYLTVVSGRQAADRLCVIDNGSFPPVPLEGIRLETNLGFAAASNVGLNHADTDAVLFLNNDVALLEHGWLDRIRAALEPGVLVGARLRTDTHGSVDGQSLPYLDGWCLAGMRDDLLEIGGWDEDLQEPAYYSDNLLSLRARAAGMTLREVKVGLLHKESVTARDNAVRMTDATLANRERFLAVARELLVPA